MLLSFLSTKTANGLLHCTLGFGWSHRKCHAGGHAMLHATFVGILVGRHLTAGKFNVAAINVVLQTPVRLGTLDIVMDPPTLYRTQFPSLASCFPSFGLYWSPPHRASEDLH